MTTEVVATDREALSDEVRDLAADFADFAAGLGISELDDRVVDAVTINIKDTLACAMAGSSAPAVDVVHDLVDQWGGGAEADVWVFGGKVPAHHAAWLNSAMSHARDFDDTHDAAILHAGVSAVPAAIAAAQLNPGCTGDDVIAAIAAGLEVMCRLGVAVQVDIVESGYIYSSLLGYFGATAAAGRALGLSSEQMWNAFGIVYSSVAGNHQVTRDASLMKRLQPGLAAQAAVVAVQMAARGIRGAQNVFEGADGFFRVYLADRVDASVARDELGRRFELLNLSYKPYPCCRDTHAAVDAALQARLAASRPAADIAAIRVGVTGPGYQMVCVPEAVRLAPKTIVEAQFSIPYTVAAAWIDGGLEMTHFTDEGLGRRDVLDLAARVRPYVDEDIDREWHRYVTPGRVIVEFTDGTSIEKRVDYPKGHPRNPMSAHEFEHKAHGCAAVSARPLAGNPSRDLAEAVDSLSTGGTLDAVLEVLRPSS